jgi:hypothetical protein
MKNVKNLTAKQHLVEEFNLHYYQLNMQKRNAERPEKRQSKLSKLFSYLANLDAGFPLSGA